MEDSTNFLATTMYQQNNTNGQNIPLSSLYQYAKCGLVVLVQQEDCSQNSNVVSPQASPHAHFMMPPINQPSRHIGYGQYLTHLASQYPPHPYQYQWVLRPSIEIPSTIDNAYPAVQPQTHYYASSNNDNHTIFGDEFQETSRNRRQTSEVTSTTDSTNNRKKSRKRFASAPLEPDASCRITGNLTQSIDTFIRYPAQYQRKMNTANIGEMLAVFQSVCEPDFESVGYYVNEEGYAIHRDATNRMIGWEEYGPYLAKLFETMPDVSFRTYDTTFTRQSMNNGRDEIINVSCNFIFEGTHIEYQPKARACIINGLSEISLVPSSAELSTVSHSQLVPAKHLIYCADPNIIDLTDEPITQSHQLSLSKPNDLLHHNQPSVPVIDFSLVFSDNELDDDNDEHSPMLLFDVDTTSESEMETESWSSRSPDTVVYRYPDRPFSSQSDSTQACSSTQSQTQNQSIPKKYVLGQFIPISEHELVVPSSSAIDCAHAVKVGLQGKLKFTINAKTMLIRRMEFVYQQQKPI